MTFGRRRLLVALAALGSGLGARRARAAGPPNPEFDELTLDVPGERLARRCLLLSPRGVKANRVVVLFHGLAETTSEAVGIRAWADRYGLVEAASRLRHPPVARSMPDAPFLTADRIAELNAALSREPFRGLAVACPYTPNVFKQPSTFGALDRYAAWIADGLLPVVRSELGLGEDPRAVALDGVSLGGFVSLEVFLRRPELFAAVGATQGAFGTNLADIYAARLHDAVARVGARSVRIATSSWDDARFASLRLAKKLAERGVSATLTVSPGPHDQRFLREVGSLELLYYYDRVLGRGTGAPASSGGREGAEARPP
jgi:pimeloyl-ACP methyl ester carboxylesterase